MVLVGFFFFTSACACSGVNEVLLRVHRKQKGGRWRRQLTGEQSENGLKQKTKHLYFNLSSGVSYELREFEKKKREKMLM